MITFFVRTFGLFLVLAAIAGVDHRDRRVEAIARNDRMVYVECLGDLFPCMHLLVGIVVGGIGALILYTSWAVTIAQFLFKKFGV